MSPMNPAKIILRIQLIGRRSSFSSSTYSNVPTDAISALHPADWCFTLRQRQEALLQRVLVPAQLTNGEAGCDERPVDLGRPLNRDFDQQTPVDLLDAGHLRQAAKQRGRFVGSVDLHDQPLARRQDLIERSSRDQLA